MANDLASYTDAVELLVDDTSNVRYSANQIAQAIRAILIDYCQATSIAHTIKDLDSASATTIPTADAGMVQMGAAGYACLSRATGQAEANVLQGDASDELRAIGEAFLEAFRMVFLPDKSKTVEKIRIEMLKANARSEEIEQKAVNTYTLQELKGQQDLNRRAASRASTLISDFRRQLRGSIKSSGAVLPPPPTDTF